MLRWAGCRTGVGTRQWRVAYGLPLVLGLALSVLAPGLVVAAENASPPVAAAMDPDAWVGGPTGRVDSSWSQDLVKDQVQALDTQPMDNLLAELNQTWAGYAPELSLVEALRLYKGEGSLWQPANLAGGLARYFFREVAANSGLLARLVVLAVLTALLQNLGTALGREGTGRLAQTVVYLVMAALALGGFGVAVTTAREAMRGLNDFMLALLPTATAIMVSLGRVSSAALLNPLLLAAANWVSGLIVAVVFPLAFIAAVLDVASGAGDHLKLTQLASLMRQGAMAVLGLSLTIFMGLTYVKAAAGGVADSVALRTTKFMAGAFIPVIGKMFADAAELIWTSGHLIKSAVGLLGLMGVFLIAALPALKILSLVLIYRVAGALVQPVGQTEIAAGLNTMASALLLVFAAVATVALMFFVGITVLIGTSAPGVV